MSVVFKCDRCGEIFNRKVPDINDCYGTANSILFLDCTVERNRFGLGEEPIQLCPSCMKELNDWLEPNEEKLDKAATVRDLQPQGQDDRQSDRGLV